MFPIPFVVPVEARHKATSTFDSPMCCRRIADVIHRGLVPYRRDSQYLSIGRDRGVFKVNGFIVHSNLTSNKKEETAWYKQQWFTCRTRSFWRQTL